jgi:hypothetical protein
MERALRGELSSIPLKLCYYPRPEEEDCTFFENEAETVEIDTPIYIRAISI